ncbi:TetR/AcrR family transcriptional regulator [Caulobacter sp. RL271]|jgi:TetR/AcrR family transcriptional repressor of nem operon|uniref:TetR/AcrR family transcriptional regulator n=1 Tax=Caulobacter segnis TaxID=88688 RepID=A0ABY4ZYG3_9CAUL|nr:TetR/AcrR family transcriptional regulator [Caulobacter segnis]USQ97017.1 TetR/AcrR family transcriptional regulator [Caulobacter segnis]
MATNDTRETILAAAQATVQARGYNALSFRELAKDVGIKSASIHYYFPTKGDLGAELARRYTDNAVGYFEQLIAKGGPIDETFARYVAVFRAALQNDNRMCLYGVMAAEYGDLPETVRTEVDAFSEANVRWLVRLLGPRHPELDTAVLRDRALAIFAAIEGAQLVARGRGDIAVFDQTMAAYRAASLTP